MSLLSFKIAGTVEAGTMDEALRALSAYCDPDNDKTDDTYPLNLITSILFHWDDDTDRPTRSGHSLEGTAVNGPIPVGQEANSE